MTKKKESNFLFNFIAPIYGLYYNSQKKHYQIIINNMREILNIADYDNIIDVGCGTGALCSVLNLEDIKVTGVDPAQKMLNIGAKKPENTKINFVKAGAASKLPFSDKSYDLSIASYVAHGIKPEERKQLYAEMSRITKRFVIIYDYNDNRSFWTTVIEKLEGGDYFRFIKEVQVELKDQFQSVQVVDVDTRASWYICVPY